MVSCGSKAGMETPAPLVNGIVNTLYVLYEPTDQSDGRRCIVAEVRPILKSIGLIRLGLFGGHKARNLYGVTMHRLFR